MDEGDGLPEGWPVSWCRLDDDMDENRKLRRLSHEAFRLYWAGVTYARRHATGGRLHADDIEVIAASQRVKNVKAAITDLLYVPTEYGFEVGCWVEIGPNLYEIHDHAEYNPPTSKERMARKRERDRASHPNGEVTASDVLVTSHPVTSSVTSDGVCDGAVTHSDVSRAQPRAGYPDPVPEPVVPTGTNVPSGASLLKARAHDPGGPLGATVLDLDPGLWLAERLIDTLPDVLPGNALSVADKNRVHLWPEKYRFLAEGGLDAVMGACREMAEAAIARGKPVQGTAYFEPGLGERDEAIRAEREGRPTMAVLNGTFAAEHDDFVAEICRATGHNYAGDGESRRVYGKKRRDGRSADDLLAAARGAALSRYHAGDNDNGIPLDSPIQILNSKMLDQLIGLGRGEIRPRPAMPRGVREAMSYHDALDGYADQLRQEGR